MLTVDECKVLLYGLVASKMPTFSIYIFTRYGSSSLALLQSNDMLKTDMVLRTLLVSTITPVSLSSSKSTTLSAEVLKTAILFILSGNNRMSTASCLRLRL